MKNNRATLRVLLDTSFILPSLGIDVGEVVNKGLKKISDIEAEIYYSSFSILESLWVAARLEKDATDIDRVDLGLRSVMESSRYKEIREDSEIFVKALEMHKLGHGDSIDNILYSTSIILNLKLLTVDKGLKEFIAAKRLTDTLMHPDQIG